MDALVHFLQEQWFGVVSLGGGIIASYIFYKKACKEKRPMYTIANNKMIANAVSELGPLKILYDNQEIPNVTATDVVFWNDGKETIHFDDIASADPLRFVATEPNEIITVRLLSSSSPANKLSPERIDKTSIELRFDYLDKGQGGFFQILHTGVKPDDLQLLGSIKGAGHPLVVTGTKRMVSFFFILQIALMLLLGWLITDEARIAQIQLNDMMKYSLTRLTDERTRHEYLRKTLDLLENEGRIDVEMQRNYLEALRVTNEAAGNDLDKLKTIIDKKANRVFPASVCVGLSIFLGLLQLFWERKIKTPVYPKHLIGIDKTTSSIK